MTATLAGCSATFSLTHRPIVPPEPFETAIFVADGAGNYQACSKTLRETIQRDKLPIYVHTFEWSHGRGRIFADQLMHDYARAAGVVMADQIADFRRARPGCRIHILGHSAGSSVALSALENLEPGVVDRAFLLAPSVSAEYDLRPALQKVGREMHVYTSRHDWWYLGVSTHILGTQDRRFLAAASGRVGFRPEPKGPEDAALFDKLKQHPWTPEQGQAGNLGGHFGAYQPEFLRRYLIPLVVRD